MNAQTSPGASAPTSAHPAESREELGVPTLFNITQRLWEHAADGLSKEELEWFSRFPEEAVRTSHNLVDVLEGLGCLVADQVVGHVGAMVEIGDAATYRLLNPGLYRKLTEAKSRR